jgi:formylglycine-generating enzyme required for sulfatase activity
MTTLLTCHLLPLVVFPVLLGAQEPKPPQLDRSRDVLVVRRDNEPNLRQGIRQALVVGINNYEHMEPLGFADKDAKDVAAALQSLDFVVEAMHSDSRLSPSQADEILTQVSRMCAAAEPATTLLVYLSGHGFSGDGGAPYFCAKRTDPKSLELTGLKLDEVIDRMRKSKARQKMLVIDACRNRAAHKGVEEQRWQVDQLQSEGLAVLYSTSDGAVSLEPSGQQKDMRGREMQNGIFTHYLLRGLEGDSDGNGDRWITFRELALYVDYEVKRETRNRQRPRSTWDGDMNFDIPLRALPLAPAQPRQTTPSLPPPPVTDSRPAKPDPANDRPPVSSEPAEADSVPGPDRLRLVKEWADVLTLEPDPDIVTDAVMRDRIQQSGYPWRVRHRATGIIMVLIPGGTFRMGSPNSEPGRGEDEMQHPRTIQRAFYLGESEVMIWQWNRDRKGGNGSSDNRPKDNLSWSDASSWAKASKLRLPSEAEWEYACRAGTETAFAFGSKVTTELVNYADKDIHGNTGDEARKFLRKASAQPTNAFGIRGMHGNLWEWVQDTYGDYEEGAGQAAVERVSGEVRRVLRGGCYASKQVACRSANREKMAPGTRNVLFGFRVARSLP